MTAERVTTLYSIYTLKRGYKQIDPLVTKRVLDLVLSFIMLLSFLPFFALASVLIRSSSRGAIIFKQIRIGKFGRPFVMYKFRTMVVDAEDRIREIRHRNETNGPAFKMENDPRITKVGRFFRKTGLDELPQLINVLKGEMSLVGPRPALHTEVFEYKEWQVKRLSVKPGMTGLWQIQPNRHKMKFADWVKLDIRYIDNWSIEMDAKILLKTINTVINRTGA